MSSIIEKFCLNLCLIDWTEKQELEVLKEELISSAQAESESLLEIEEEFIIHCQESVERKIQIINHIVGKIDEFISKTDN